MTFDLFVAPNLANEPRTLFEVKRRLVLSELRKGDGVLQWKLAAGQLIIISVVGNVFSVLVRFREHVFVSRRDANRIRCALASCRH
jgi:hypothetical protein